MSERRTEKRGLGRGLSALMADVGLDPESPSGVRAEAADLSQLRQVPIDEISPNPDQPRRRFNEAGSCSLWSSGRYQVRRQGIRLSLVRGDGARLKLRRCQAFP